LSSSIEAQEGHIEVEAGEVEIVRIAAEEGRGDFGREDKAHIGVATVLVELVLAATIEAHHLAAIALVGGAGLLLELGHRGIPRAVESLARQAFARGANGVGDVGDFRENLSLLARALALLVPGRGQESVLHIVGLRARQVLHAVHHTVVVGEHKTLSGDHRGRAAIGQAHGGGADLVQPGLVDLHPIGGLDLGGREVIERPHAFVGLGGAGRQAKQKNARGGGGEQG